MYYDRLVEKEIELKLKTSGAVVYAEVVGLYLCKLPRRLLLR